MNFLNPRNEITGLQALFTKALAMDPKHIDAAMALVDLHMANRRYDDCVALLQRCLQNHNQDFLHTKLADVLTANGQHSDALAYYHTAMSLNPSNAQAKAGLDRLEKLMRGVDPDQDENSQGEEELTGDEAEAADASGSMDASLEGSQYI
jgi:tetratricopeptide (TPR) repeat protein